MSCFLDGTSSTVAFGEAEFDIDVRGIDHGGTIHLVDHWYIGSPSINPSEVSETVGSTAVPVNAIFDAAPTSRQNVANFIANLAAEPELWSSWRGQMPVIYNAS